MNSPASAQIEQLHLHYCRLTHQSLSLHFDRQRLWFEFIRAGFTIKELTRVIAYLQKEIRHNRRNVGALKLSNLLQLDRFEEDFNISRVALSPQPPPSPPSLPPTSSLAQQEQGRQRALLRLRELQDKLRRDDI